jgi:hypothetical protein
MKKIKIIIAVLILVFTSGIAIAQSVSINNNGNAAHASAILDVSASDKGILIPRVDFNDLPANPPESMIVFVTANGPSGDDLLYFYVNNRWKPFSSGLFFEVINDDNVHTKPNNLLVTKLAIGFDSFNGESFNDDVDIKLKENNLRLTFLADDSGPTGGTDWMIEANESSNGGLHQLTIHDETNNTIPFGVARASVNNGLYVKGSNIGLETNDPQVNMHMMKGTDPTIRLHQDNTDANPEQIWDIVANDNFFKILDISGATTPFSIVTNSPSNSIYIKSDGNVGFGTDQPERKVHVNGAVRFEPQGSAPSSPAKGDIYFDNATSKMKCYDGTVWQNLW